MQLPRAAMHRLVAQGNDGKDAKDNDDSLEKEHE